jgi:ubiquinone/menaquinone biosynthesis C-methylase UbiE
MGENYLDKVRGQYEQFPYPPRDPADERHRLLEAQIDRLALVNFYCFRGQADFAGARVLVAGGGTGDATIYLAEQLLRLNGEVVYVDISESSMQVAKRRADIRKLNNIRWIHGSILSLSPETVGFFDYISCTGVLHHLDDPAHGLKCLKSVLKPSGAMGILVYAKYGRTGVYQLQELLRLINREETEMADKIVNTRRVLQELPESNWFRHNERFLSDHKNLGDSGLVDLLLHQQDVAYSIGEVHALLAQAGLHLVEFTDVRLRMSYRPEQYVRDQTLLQKIARLDRVTQQGIAELLVGLFTKHMFYASCTTDSQASLGDLSDIPFFFPARQYRTMGQQISEAMSKRPQQLIPLRHASGFEFDLVSEPISAAIFSQIDGTRDWRQIFGLVRAEITDLKLSDQELLDSIRSAFEQFRRLDWLLLRAASVGEFPDTLELQANSELR